jgi:MraZ protein
MFRGTSYHIIDAKGRIKIPSRFREKIRQSETDVIMVSRFDNCLVSYTMDEWRKVEERILSLSENSEVMRRFRRFFIGGASECICDNQDRILIPPKLREDTELEKDIVLVGVLNHFEIWSKQNYDIEELALASDMKKEDLRNEIGRLRL